MGITLAFATLLSWSVSDLLLKHALSRQSIWFTNFWAQCLGGIGILGVGFGLGKIQAFSMEALGWITVLGFINIIGMITFYKAVQHKGVSLSLPIIYSWSVPAIILSMIFLGQIPSLHQWVGVATILVGLFLVTMNLKEKTKLDEGIVFAFLSMMIWGVFYFIIADPSALYGEWALAGGLKIVSGLLSLPFLLKEKSKTLTLPRARNLWPLVSIGVLDALGLVALSTGFQLSTTAIVTGITSTTPVVVAFFGILLFKEKVTVQQGFGILATVAGLILLVF